MLILEKQKCRDAKHHRDCQWVEVSRRSDKMYYNLVQQAVMRVKRDGLGRRIRHTSNGHTLVTFKLGHDGEIFTQGTRQGAKLYLYWATHHKAR